MTELAQSLQPWLAAWLDAALAVIAGCALLAPCVPMQQLRALSRVAAVALGIGLCGHWWAGAVVMTEASGSEISSAMWQVLTVTHFGAAICLAALAWLLLAGAAFAPMRHPSGMRRALMFAGLLLFALARAAGGHAAEQGWWSVALLAQWVHVSAACAWAGVVTVAACATIGWRAWTPSERAAVAQHASAVATVALFAVIAAGLLRVWQMLGHAEQIWPSAYTKVLTFKLCAVALAACLGAWNRWRELPRIVNPQTQSGTCVFARVLLIETVVLCLVIVAASLLSFTMPPE